MEVAGVDGKLFGVEVGPHCRLGIEGALDVVGLVGDEFADADDEIREAFAGGPMIADTDGGGVDVGVEYRGEHPAMRGKAWVVGGKANFDLMNLAGDGLVGFAAFEAADEVFDFVQVGWIAFGAGNADEGEGFEGGGEMPGVRMEAPDAEGDSAGGFGRGGR